MLFLDRYIEDEMNMKLPLKIIFHKSESFVEQAKHCDRQYSQLFGYKLKTCPFHYLWIPMQYKILTTKTENSCVIGKEKMLSLGGRSVLINSALSS